MKLSLTIWFKGKFENGPLGQYRWIPGKVCDEKLLNYNPVILRLPEFFFFFSFQAIFLPVYYDRKQFIPTFLLVWNNAALIHRAFKRLFPKINKKVS